MSRTRHRGFTLIELMMTVAILGVLSSVAMPELGRMTLRARTAERRTVLIAIARAMSDVTLNQGRVPNGGTFVGDWNPAGTATPAKREMSRTAPGWSQLPLEIEGRTYYSYKFVCEDHGGLSQVTLDTFASGDLDGDGTPSPKHISYLGFGNAYHQILEDPLQGEEDKGTF
jgi:prepilin-type N-terminal cleavage/methylation domain-containing protein